MKEIFLSIVFSFLATALFSQTIQWQEEFPGVWKGTFGKPDTYNLLSASKLEPNGEAIRKMAQQSFPLSKDDIRAEMIAGKTYLRFPLEKEEQVYGLGLNFQTVQQRGKILNLHVDHYGGKDNGRTHAPVPFYVSSRGYGVFINSAQYLTFYVGTGVRKDSKNPPVAKDRNTDNTWSARPYSDAVEVLVPAEGVEFYIFAGPTGLDAIRRYNLYCGGGCLPPRWGLGFTQRVQKLYTAAQVEQEAADFEKNGYPLDFIGLEPGWQSKAYPCTFEWDEIRFPDPGKFTRKLLSKGIRLNLWTNPYVSPDASVYKAIEPYTGSHTVWCGVVPDLNHPEAKRILSNQFVKDQVKIGISGYKIDEVDGYDYYLWPDIATFPSGISGIQMRQTYGVLAQKLTDELYRKENIRTFGLVRASNAGANHLPYVIYNDYYSHQDFITALVNSGFCGVLWTPEVRGSKTGEEWLRRFQSVVFSPMAMINAWSSGTKPWSFPEVAEQIKYYANLRMQLMPYFYSEFAKYHFEGTPPFRAMVLEEGFGTGGKTVAGNRNLEDNPYLEAVNKDVKDQYMAGEYLLVAPLFTGETSRKVLLPKGDWYDFYTGEYAGNGEEIAVHPGLDRIPVFVKDGGIIPMMETRLHAPASGEKINIEVRHYGKKEGLYRLYDDDGETFDYEKGDYSWREIMIVKDENGNLQGTISKPAKGKPDNIGKVTFNLTASAQGIVVKGDEQGLDVGKLDLHQDSVAVEEALSGWWKNSRQTLDERMSWYDDAKFGCFVHWGVYSVPGGEWDGKAVTGYSEHLMRKEQIPLAGYKEKVVKPFNPVEFDADEWMRTAKEAGMRYFIITAKHHDGFAMYFSDAYPYDMRLTQYNRDPMKKLREAARKYGLKFGFYYSHAFDWEHPDAPGNDWDYDNPGGDKLLHGANWWNNYPEFLPHAEKYVNEKSIPQIVELIQKYQPDILWFDTPHKLPLYENVRILQAIREVAPDIVVNGRLARFSGKNLGDYLNTGDRAAYFFPVKDKYWESIPTTNESYGYSKYDKSHKSSAYFIRLLSSAAAKGGNILMNVGPMGNGKWDEADVKIFKGVGDWLKINGESIYGTERTTLPVQNWGVITQKDNIFYLHIHHWPVTGKLMVGGLSADVKQVQIVSTGEKLKYKQLEKDLQIKLPAVCPDTTNTVIKLSVREYHTYQERLLDPYSPNTLLAFDARMEGNFIPGDGKMYRNYVSGWKNDKQTISWNVSLLKPATFRVSVGYNKENPSDSGTVLLEIDGKTYEASYPSGSRNTSLETLGLGTVKLSAGKHVITLKGKNYNGSQYMRPMNLMLIPE